MTAVSTYLNFTDSTEEAFLFYRSVLGGEFAEEGFMRFRDVPPGVNTPTLSEKEKDLILHVTLVLPGGSKLMGSDAPESMGFSLNQGNNVYIMLAPETRDETRRLFDALSEGGVVEQPLMDMFWGDYYGSCKDKFGVQWMFNCTVKG